MAFSKNEEFVFGDGFYNNFTSSIGVPLYPMIMIPVLPDVCVFYARPPNCKVKKRLSVIYLAKHDVDLINQTTMTYSKDCIFYRSKKPNIAESFGCGRYLEYDQTVDPIEEAFSQIFDIQRAPKFPFLVPTRRVGTL